MIGIHPKVKFEIWAKLDTNATSTALCYQCTFWFQEEVIDAVVGFIEPTNQRQIIKSIWIDKE